MEAVYDLTTPQLWLEINPRKKNNDNEYSRLFLPEVQFLVQKMKLMAHIFWQTFPFSSVVRCLGDKAVGMK